MKPNNNIEFLISKYIDGELSFEEDLALRELVNIDPEYRKIYQDSINIHLAIKEDSESISIPDKLYSETEDLILMKILSTPPIVERKAKVLKISRISWRNLSIAACLLLMFNLFKISDFNNNFNSKYIFLSEIPVENTNNVELKSSNRFNTKNKINNQNIVNDNIALVKNTETQNSSLNINLNEPEIDVKINDNETIISSIVDDNNAQNKVNGSSISTNPDNEASNNNIIKNSNSNLNLNNNMLNENFNNNLNYGKLNNIVSNAQNSKNVNMNIDPLFMENSGIKDIQTTTLMANSFDNSNRDQTANLKVNNFIQSLAYSVSETNRFGIEAGRTDMTFKDLHATFNYTDNVINNQKKVEFSPMTKNGISTIIEVNRTHSFYWGAAFYETEVYNINSLNLNFLTRVGAGISGDGLVGYGRFITKFKVFDFLNFTAGLETRYFAIDVPSSYKLKESGISSNSIFYGLQFKF